jgi:hypothetical protein
MDEPNQQRRLSLASSKHYWDYKISDGSGNIDGRLGLKLHDPEVEVVDYFSTSKPIAPTENLGSLVSLKVWERDRIALAHFQELFEMDNRQDTNHFILDTFSRLLDTADSFDLTPRQLLERLSQQDDGNLHHHEEEETNGRVQTLPQPQSTHTISTALESKIERQQQSMSELTAAIHRLVDVLSSPKHSFSPVNGT